MFYRFKLDYVDKKNPHSAVIAGWGLWITRQEHL